MKYLAAVLFIGMLSGGLGQSIINLGTILVASENNNPTNYNESTLKTINGCNKDGCVGRVWIYYSGVATPTQWGTISKTGMTTYARNITCRQLGYKESNDSRQSSPQNPEGDSPVWITETNCSVRPSVDPQHYDKNNILQCNPEVCRPDKQDCRNHNNDLMISCNGALHSSEYDYYDGEVFLCPPPPTQKPYGMQTSMGLLQIHIDKNIKGITIEDPTGYRDHFESSKRNSFCRQLGFTQAVTDSLYTKRALSYWYNFSNCFLTSWYNATQLRECSTDKSSTACFGCCLKYPDDPRGCPTDSCQPDNLIAIACLYDPHNEGAEFISNGYRGICELQNKKLKNHDAVCHCGPAIPYTTTLVIAILGALAGVLLISSLILLALYCTITAKNNGGCNRDCIGWFCCYWCRLCCERRHEYNNINANKPDGQQE